MPRDRVLLGGLLGDGFTEDRRDRLVMALEGMTLNPNAGLMRAAEAGIEGRAKNRETARAEQQSVRQQNATATWLRSQGRDDLAAALESGAIPAQAAVQAAMQAPESTSGIREYEYARSQGFQGTFADYQAAVAEAKRPQTNVNVNAASEVGTIPQGWELITDPETGGRRLQQIKDGPADTSKADAAKAGQEAQKASVVIDTIGRAREVLTKSEAGGRGLLDLPEAGIIGSRLASAGVNQEAVDLRNMLATLQSSVAFDTLAKMREASPTGGALGAVSERELTLLQSALGSLSQDASPQELLRTLSHACACAELPFFPPLTAS
jgi:hypothetical protein